MFPKLPIFGFSAFPCSLRHSFLPNHSIITAIGGVTSPSSYISTMVSLRFLSNQLTSFFAYTYRHILLSTSNPIHPNANDSSLHVSIHCSSLFNSNTCYFSIVEHISSVNLYMCSILEWEAKMWLNSIYSSIITTLFPIHLDGSGKHSLCNIIHSTPFIFTSLIHVQCVTVKHEVKT